MKKSIIILLAFLSIEGYSQISLDFQIPGIVQPFKLNSSETKYFSWEGLNLFSLYNSDGSFYKTIQMPSPPYPSSEISNIAWVSESLFDNDPSNIEYLVWYSTEISPDIYQSQTKVIREDGTVLLNEMDASFFGDFGSFCWGNELSEGVYSTEEGTKMMLYYESEPFWGYKVFNLPGSIPTNVKDEMNTIHSNLTLYPNPNKGSFFIKLHSSEGTGSIIDLYSSNGKLIDTYQSTDNLIHVNNPGLSDGLYLINSRSQRNISTAKMIIEK